MVELTAENGKTAKRTAMASAQDQKDRLATKALGTTDSNLAAFMFGLMATVSKANGSMAVDMDSALKTEVNGLTKANGMKDIRHVTEYRNQKAELVMREVGLLVYKKDMESKITPTEVRFSKTNEKKLQ